MTRTPRGVRSISEKIIQPGRALVITDKTESNYDWADIPDGSIFVNSVTGTLSVKIEGHSNWAPLPELLKNGENSLIIARDGKIVTEVYNVISIGETEVQIEDRKGEFRYMKIMTDDVTGQKMYVLELMDGSYLPRRNQISLKINDVLERTAISGGLVELTNRKVGILDTLKAGDELTVTYYMRIMIGNPYPRIYMSKYLPDNPEEGDFWLDLTEPTVSGQSYPEKIIEDNNSRYQVIK